MVTLTICSNNKPPPPLVTSVLQTAIMKHNLKIPMRSNSEGVSFCSWRVVKMLFSDTELVEFFFGEIYMYADPNPLILMK